MRTRIVVLAIALSTLALTPLASARRACRGVSDGILCLPLSRGWSSFVNRGHAGGFPAAYLLAGNFRFRLAGHPETGPPVPPRKVLVSIGDFPMVGRSKNWRRVRRLRLPSRPIARRFIHWEVRFADRAVSVGVQFGSKPTAQVRALVNARLALVRRVGR